jgi:hypothetical protein
MNHALDRSGPLSRAFLLLAVIKSQANQREREEVVVDARIKEKYIKGGPDIK